jgi:hypothetical protein
LEVSTLNCVVVLNALYSLIDGCSSLDDYDGGGTIFVCSLQENVVSKFTKTELGSSIETELGVCRNNNGLGLSDRDLEYIRQRVNINRRSITRHNIEDAVSSNSCKLRAQRYVIHDDWLLINH